jgi:hypothetical protein
MADSTSQKRTQTLSDGQWDTCCSRTSQSFIKYSVQVAIGLIVILFAMIQIINKAENKEIYFSLLSGTMGIFFPHPSLSTPQRPSLSSRNLIARITPTESHASPSAAPPP